MTSFKEPGLRALRPQSWQAWASQRRLLRSEAPGQLRYCSRRPTLFITWDTELCPLDARVSLKFYSCADSQRGGRQEPQEGQGGHWSQEGQRDSRGPFLLSPVLYCNPSRPAEAGPLGWEQEEGTVEKHTRGVTAAAGHLSTQFGLCFLQRVPVQLFTQLCLRHHPWRLYMGQGAQLKTLASLCNGHDT